jgi:uncharacterized protein (DUF1330 family)
MVAYVISDVEPRDAGLIERYRDLAQGSVARYGGRYIVRGGPVETIEGDWTPKYLVIIEFPDLDRAHQWYRSEAYAEALTVAERALSRRLVFVDGVSVAQMPQNEASRPAERA